MTMGRSPTGKKAMSDAERQRKYFARLRKGGGRQEIARILELIEENLALRQQLCDALARVPRTQRPKRKHNNDEIKRLRRQLARARRTLREEAHAPKRTMQIKGFDV